MLIDWFTVAAQIVNFLVLVLLMKHFLYGRLIRTIDERQKRIAARFAEAEAKQKSADQQLEQVNAQLHAQQQQCAQLRAQAQQEADRQQKEMIEKARASVAALEAQWNETFLRDRSASVAGFRRSAAAGILDIMRRALRDLASTDLRQAAFQVFLEKLRSLDLAELRKLTSGEVNVLTAEALSDEMKHQIEATLAERLGAPIAVHFELTSTMSWGVEMQGSGQRLGWSSESYLDSLEQHLRTDLEHPEEMVQRTTIG
jgi:F-type H+-transporting ATPase subunit b